MKLLKLIIIALLFSNSLNAQISATNSEAIGDDWSFVVQGNATSVTGANPYTLTVITGTNLTSIGSFNLSNVQIGDILFSSNNGIYEVTSTNNASQPILTVQLLNDPLLLGFPVAPSGKVVISRPHDACGTVANYVADGGVGISFGLSYLIASYNQQRTAKCIEESRVIMTNSLPTTTPNTNQSHIQLDTTSNKIILFNEGTNSWEYLQTGGFVLPPYYLSESAAKSAGLQIGDIFRYAQGSTEGKWGHIGTVTQ